MKTSVVLVIDTRRAKADGSYALLLRIIHNRQSSQISLGIAVHEKDWDDTQRKIKSSYRGTESVTRLNNYLQKKKAEALDIITKLDEAKTLGTLSVTQLKDLIEQRTDGLSFFRYAEKLIAEMELMHKVGNARIYSITLSVLKTFAKDKDLSFRDISYGFLMKFEASHLTKGNALNGLAVYTRTIRAIFNRAIKDGVINSELYPFKNYQIKTTKTRKRAINIDAIKKIEALELEPKHSLFDTRNYFLISFYMRGLPFADLARLQPTTIIDGRVYYQRKKTDKPYNIKITPEIQAILNIYLRPGSKQPYIFPVINRETEKEQYKDIEWARKRYNKKLKKLATLCGIEENLTSYVSRHSFASRAKNLGIPIASISDMLGHGDSKTTEIYLDSLPSDIMDDFHEQIIR